jgi:hypothetical protein
MAAIERNQRNGLQWRRINGRRQSAESGISACAAALAAAKRSALKWRGGVAYLKCQLS